MQTLSIFVFLCLSLISYFVFVGLVGRVTRCLSGGRKVVLPPRLFSKRRYEDTRECLIDIAIGTFAMACLATRFGRPGFVAVFAMVAATVAVAYRVLGDQAVRFNH